MILELLEMISLENGFAKLLDSLGGLPVLVNQLDSKAGQNKDYTNQICLLRVLANVSRNSAVFFIPSFIGVSFLKYVFKGTKFIASH